MDSFGDNIRAAREQRGLKQINVANACNMKQQYISSLERNKKSPSDTTLRRIAENGLNMTLEELKNLDALVQHNSDQ
jgi:transcriptional regulator with XRE-family HTH domain